MFSFITSIDLLTNSFFDFQQIQLHLIRTSYIHTVLHNDRQTQSIPDLKPTNTNKLYTDQSLEGAIEERNHLVVNQQMKFNRHRTMNRMDQPTKSQIQTQHWERATISFIIMRQFPTTLKTNISINGWRQVIVTFITTHTSKWKKKIGKRT